MMYKLDGLVIQLCIRKFTGYDLRRKAMGKVVELEGEIESKRALQQSYRDIAQGLHENYSAVMKRIIRFAKDDAEAENWIAAERSEYERKCEENSKVIDTLKNEIAGLNRRRTSLLKVEDKPEFAERQAEILMDRSLVKEYINEYIQDIVMYNRETRRITEKITSLVHKTYTFEEFNDIAAARGWMGEFKPYEF